MKLYPSSLAAGYRDHVGDPVDRMAPFVTVLPDLGMTQVREGGHLLCIIIPGSDAEHGRIGIMIGEARGPGLPSRALLHTLDEVSARQVAAKLIELADRNDAAATAQAAEALARARDGSGQS